MLVSTPTGWSGVVTDASPRLASPRGAGGATEVPVWSCLASHPGEKGGWKAAWRGRGLMGPEIGPSGPSSGGELESPAPAIPSPARPRLGRGVGPPLRPLWCSTRSQFRGRVCVRGWARGVQRAYLRALPSGAPPRKRRGITFSSLLQTLDERERSPFSPFASGELGHLPGRVVAGEPNEDKDLLHQGVRLVTASHGPPSPAEDGGPRRNPEAAATRKLPRAWSFCSLEGENRGRGGRAGAEIWGWGGFFRPLGARRRPLDPPPQPPQPSQPFQPRAKLFQRRLAFPPGRLVVEEWQHRILGCFEGSAKQLANVLDVFVHVQRGVLHP